METLIGKNNGIKEVRLKALKENYQKPEIARFTFNEITPGECSDMGSCPFVPCSWFMDPGPCPHCSPYCAYAACPGIRG
jgi:hypothetical protein